MLRLVKTEDMHVSIFHCSIALPPASPMLVLAQGAHRNVSEKNRGDGSDGFYVKIPCLFILYDFSIKLSRKYSILSDKNPF